MEPKIQFEHVSKSYGFYKNQLQKLRDLFSLKSNKKSFSALNDISFTVSKGESIGIIGINGSGKSTLSNLLAQLVEPSSGKITINGTPSLIAISAGLNNNISGYENIKLKCLMLGLKQSEIKEIIPKVIEFAEIGNFIHQPVKSYSSGMKSRLGFAISVHTNPDILIIDEALSVGDQTFYQKCLNKIDEFKEQGKTIFFVSHSISQIRSFSDRVLWLHFGEIKAFGEKMDVLHQYNQFIKWFNQLEEREKKDFKNKKVQEQFYKIQQKNDYFRRSSRSRTKKQMMGTWGFAAQILVLAAGLAFSIAGMAASYDYGPVTNLLSGAPKDHTIQDKVETAPPKAEEINEDGIINQRETQVFGNLELTKEISTLEFGTPVHIQEKANDTYKISFNQSTGYIKTLNGEPLAVDSDSGDLSIEELLSSMPATFVDSYSFYMAFLGKDIEQVKQGIWDNPEESDTGDGNKLLSYEASHIEYGFNPNNIAESISIKNINTEDSGIQEITSESAVRNTEQQLYFKRYANFDVVIDVERKIISFTEGASQSASD